MRSIELAFGDGVEEEVLVARAPRSIVCCSYGE